MNDFPWYEEVPPDNPLTQGDFVEKCPVLVFNEIPELNDITNVELLVQELQQSAGIEMTRAIVMTQACDIAWGHVRNVILCPIYDLSEYKDLWERMQHTKGQSVSNTNWEKHVKKVKDGQMWNLAMLNQREISAEDRLSIGYQIVDFHEVFSVPLEFLKKWILTQNINRLRLLPPYREHLSQAFARFFMRVGLPNDIQFP